MGAWTGRRWCQTDVINLPNCHFRKDWWKISQSISTSKQKLCHIIIQNRDSLNLMLTKHRALKFEIKRFSAWSLLVFCRVQPDWSYWIMAKIIFLGWNMAFLRISSYCFGRKSIPDGPSCKGCLMRLCTICCWHVLKVAFCHKEMILWRNFCFKVTDAKWP